MYTTTEMYLVYRDEQGRFYCQQWEDISVAGTLIDPDSGDDMELVGWTTTNFGEAF